MILTWLVIALFVTLVFKLLLRKKTYGIVVCFVISVIGTAAAVFFVDHDERQRVARLVDRPNRLRLQLVRVDATRAKQAELVIILGTDHYGSDGSITLTTKPYKTPFGVLPTEPDLVEALVTDAPSLERAKEILDSCLKIQ